MKTLSRMGFALATSALLTLGGCWGGSDDDAPPVTAQVPQSANDSIDGFIAYLQALVLSDADTLEPVDVAGVNPPQSDGAEPQ